MIHALGGGAVGSYFGWWFVGRVKAWRMGMGWLDGQVSVGGF